MVCCVNAVSISSKLYNGMIVVFLYSLTVSRMLLGPMTYTINNDHPTNTVQTE